MTLNIDTYELDLWKQELAIANANVDIAQAYLDSDPTEVLINIQIDFAKLLKKYTGKKRQDPEFNESIKELAIKEKEARMRIKTFDFADADFRHSQSVAFRQMIQRKVNELCQIKTN